MEINTIVFAFNTCGVYSITCTKSNKIYIGSSIDIDNRWIEHLVRLRKGNHHSAHMQAAWNKYGKDAFKFEIIAFCNPDELIALEQFYIDSHQSANNRYGYNVSPIAGSPLGVKHSDKAKEKVSVAVRERWKNEEYKARLSIAQKEAQNRPEVKKKRAESTRREWEKPEARARRLLSFKEAQNRPEVKAKRVAALRERWNKPGAREKMSATMKKVRARPDRVLKVPKSKARCGENNGYAKLTEKAVCDIRKRLELGETQVSIAARYGVLKTTISKIKRGKTWMHAVCPQS